MYPHTLRLKLADLACIHGLFTTNTFTCIGLFTLKCMILLFDFL